MPVSLAQTGGDTKVYVVNGPDASGKSASSWMDEKATQRKKKTRKRTSTDDGEIRLIQDFAFPEASNKIKTTPDGRYAIATGVYKPRMRIFDLPELSMKTDRVTDAETIDFAILSEDWTKTLLLQSDRNIEVHTQSSAYDRIRVPKPGRAIAYHYPSTDALVATDGGHVFRFNLELGRYMRPFGLEGSGPGDTSIDSFHQGWTGSSQDLVTGVNAIDINPATQLVAFGTETESGQGTVEYWDMRSRTRAGILRLPYQALHNAASIPSLAQETPDIPLLDASQTGHGIRVTSLASKSNGLHLGVGTSTGHTLVYDIRSSSPISFKDQGFGSPVKKLEFISSTDAQGYLASADDKTVKVWNPYEPDDVLFSINPTHSLNDMHIYPGTGLVLVANEAPAISAYYVPRLGPSPRWARFLDNMSEEMENEAEILVHDDEKFLDRAQLEALNLTHLLGTDALTPKMHGFLVNYKVYADAKAAANPFEYAEYRDRLVRDRIAKEEESSIRGAKKTAPSTDASVNKSLAERIAHTDKPHAKALLSDDRFQDLFHDKDFEVDETSREYALLHPTAPKRAQEQDSDDENAQALNGSVSDSDQDSDQDHEDDDHENDFSSEDDEGLRESGDNGSEMTSESNDSASEENRGIDSEFDTASSSDETPPPPKQKASIRSNPSASVFALQEKKNDSSLSQMTLADKLKLSRSGEKENSVVTSQRLPGGGIEFSYVPQGRPDKKTQRNQKTDERKKRDSQVGATLSRVKGGPVNETHALSSDDASGRKFKRSRQRHH